MAFVSPKELVAFLNIPHGAVVADFGCGTGTLTFLISQRVGTSGKVYALDIQKNLLENVRERAREEHIKNIEVLWSDLEEEGGSHLPDSSCDFAVCANILFQIEHKEKFFAEVIRILKPGGVFSVIDWSESFGNMGPHQDAVVEKFTVKEIAARCGLAFHKEFPAGDYHYGLLFKKNEEAL